MCNWFVQCSVVWTVTIFFSFYHFTKKQNTWTRLCVVVVQNVFFEAVFNLLVLFYKSILFKTDFKLICYLKLLQYLNFNTTTVLSMHPCLQSTCKRKRKNLLLLLPLFKTLPGHFTVLIYCNNVSSHITFTLCFCFPFKNLKHTACISYMLLRGILKSNKMKQRKL